MNPREKFLARLMNFLAEKYKSRLVLKGGMLLRLLNSPRQTQDLDYAWVREKKRNIFAKELKETLIQMEGVLVTDVSVNSRGIFLEVRDQNTRQLAKIEINGVDSLHRPPEPLTNSRLVEPFSLPARIVATMNLSEALSHKLAASLERNLVRDLYDLMILEPLAVFDEKTLEERLAQLSINRNKPRKSSLPEAAEMLKKKLENLSEKKIKQELGAFLSEEKLAGLKTIIQSSVHRIIQRMESVS